MKPNPYASNLHVQDQSRKAINGPRPSPLKINTDSHLIRKHSSSSTYSSSSSDVVSVITTDMNSKQVRKPIIIYTHSPKVIHTKAQDFMSLVQKLTGMPRPHQNDVVSAAVTENLGSSLSDNSINSIKQEIKERSTGGATENDDEGNETTSSALCKGPNVQFSYADVPLFTPNFSDFLSPSRSVYKYSDSPFGILGSLISPSGLEFIKELPEY